MLVGVVHAELRVVNPDVAINLVFYYVNCDATIPHPCGVMNIDHGIPF